MTTPGSPGRPTGPEAVTPRVKICGLTRLEDGELAAASGADYLGIIASPGFGRSVDPALGATLARRTGLPVVAVTVNAGIGELAALASRSSASG